MQIYRGKPAFMSSPLPLNTGFLHMFGIAGAMIKILVTMIFLQQWSLRDVSLSFRIIASRKLIFLQQY